MILNCSCTLPVRLSPPNIQTAPVVPKPWRKRTTLGHDPSGCALHGGICKLNIRKLCVKKKNPSTTQQPHPSTTASILQSSTSSLLEVNRTTSVSTLKTDVSKHGATQLTLSTSTTFILTSKKLETPAVTEQSSTGHSIVVMSVVGGLALLIVALIASVVFLWCRRKKLGHEYATPLPVRQYQTETGSVSSVDISVDQSGYTDLSQGNRLPEHAYQSLTQGGYGPHDDNHQSEDSYTELRDIPVAPYQSLRLEQALEQASDHGHTELTDDT
ncbi:uncharacterized protein [Ptychodera flava]|uniref:uncharacterized protein n=1 Tax=Ptychodera flava TaxID=63121 RepID=UPI00396A81FD